MVVLQFHGIYIVADGIGVKGFQFAFDGFDFVDPSHWCMSFDVVAHASCACVSSKLKIFCSLSVILDVHMLDCEIKWLLSFNCKSVISIRDAVTGEILSLTTNPGFWVLLSNDPYLGTAFDCACCFCQLSIHVGSHFICRS